MLAQRGDLRVDVADGSPGLVGGALLDGDILPMLDTQLLIFEQPKPREVAVGSERPAGLELLIDEGEGPPKRLDLGQGASQLRGALRATLGKRGALGFIFRD